ncbi:MAG TPA: 4-hydroxythreonine-4-phosphate dehydrogenase PdxA [Bryobacteraceae bacterium]|jgi:4-hydroxythreonine-4-phosphate dehydrogenase
MTFGITMGDSSGVGPEILLKAYRAGELRHEAVVFGDLAILEAYNRRLAYGVPLRQASGPSDWQAGELNVVDQAALSEDDLTPGQLSGKSGAAARDYVIAAAQAALAGQISAIVTLPMNKEATRLSDPTFTGHTELIGALCGSSDVTIMLASEQLIVTHVSTHVSLTTAIARVKKERVQRIIELTCDVLARLKEHPRVAVAGLNPHAGEHGLFGREEIEEIEPAIAWARERGMPVEGPIPPDTLFYMAVKKKLFDAVVCMYHDQGHIPLKLLDFEGGVNVTLGLPIIRTSVDHGTAFDIAGKGVASTVSLVKALEFAARLARL